MTEGVWTRNTRPYIPYQHLFNIPRHCGLDPQSHEILNQVQNDYQQYLRANTVRPYDLISVLYKIFSLPVKILFERH